MVFGPHVCSYGIIEMFGISWCPKKGLVPHNPVHHGIYTYYISATISDRCTLGLEVLDVAVSH